MTLFMLLNSHSHTEKLFAIRDHAASAYQSIQRESWPSLCGVVKRSWELNQVLDTGTNPPEVAAILDSVRDWTAGAKLLGAGGGGYMWAAIWKSDRSGCMNIGSW